MGRGLRRLALAITGCGLVVWRRAFPGPDAAAARGAEQPQTIGWPRRLRWLVLALVPSSLLLAVTTHITTDLAAVPLLWVVPLALYLLTFVVASRAGRGCAKPGWSRPSRSSSSRWSCCSPGPCPGWHCRCTCSALRERAGLPRRALRDCVRPERLTEFYFWMAAGGRSAAPSPPCSRRSCSTACSKYPLALVAACLLRPTLAPALVVASWISHCRSGRHPDRRPQRRGCRTAEFGNAGCCSCSCRALWRSMRSPSGRWGSDSAWRRPAAPRCSPPMRRACSRASAASSASIRSNAIPPATMCCTAPRCMAPSALTPIADASRSPTSTATDRSDSCSTPSARARAR